MSAGRRRIVIALVISFAWNAGLVLLDGVREPVKHPIPALDRLVDAVFYPGIAFARIFIAPGHDFGYLVAMPILAFGFSIIFYGLLIWIALGLPELWKRDRNSTVNS